MWAALNWAKNKTLIIEAKLNKFVSNVEKIQTAFPTQLQDVGF